MTKGKKLRTMHLKTHHTEDI